MCKAPKSMPRSLASNPLAVSAFVATLLAGCATMAPKYERPAAPVPAAFPTGDAYPVAQAALPPAAEIGWQGFFTDPKLKAVIAQALAENRDLRVAIINIQEARQQYRVQSAAELPTLNASSSATYQHTPTDVALGSIGAAFPGLSIPQGGVYSQEYTASVGISDYELDLWGRVRSLTKQALEQYLSTVETRRETQITIVSEVATDYLTSAADLQRLQVAKDTLASDQKTYDLTVAKFTAGISSQVDVRQAETTLEQARSSVSTYTTQVAQDINALTLVVGASVDPALLPTGQDDSLPTLSDLPAGLTSATLLTRPDVLEAEHTLKGYNANIGAARAAFFPTVSLTASGGGASVNLTRLFNSNNGAWSFQPNITLPIFDGGANLAKLRYAKEEKAAAVAQYEKAIQTAFREVADALAQRGTIEAQLQSQERLVKAASGSLGLSTARYRSGTDPFLNTLTAQVTLYGAQQSLISARLTRATNLVALYRTLGGGLDVAATQTLGTAQASGTTQASGMTQAANVDRR
jgi:multidrug efflux system outer membrane protein